MAVTAATLITDMRYELEDTGSDAYTDAEMLVYINDAQRALSRRVAATWPAYWRGTGETYVTTTDIVADTAEYTLPVALYMVDLVTFTDSDDDTVVLDPISLEETIEHAAPGVEPADGYYLLNNKLVLFPTPDTSVTGGLKIYYVPRPTNLTVTSGNVLMADVWGDWVKGYVLLKCRARHGEEVGTVAAFFERFQAELDALVKRQHKSKRDAGLHTGWRNWS